MSARYSRRRRALRLWVLPAALAVVGFTAGLVGSHVWPWGWAPPPPLPELQPRPGLVLSAGDVSALVHTGSVFVLPDGARVGAVSYLRGRDGREALRALGCDEGRGVLVPLHEPRERRPWRRGGRSIEDVLGAAICYTGEPEQA